MSGIYEVEGRWIDDPHHLHWKGYSHSFDRIEATRTSGIIVGGDKYVVRIESGEPHVVLGWKHGLHEFPPHGAFAELDTDTLMFAGAMLEPHAEEHGLSSQLAVSNVLVTTLDRDGTQATHPGPPRVGGERWDVVDLESREPGAVFAILSVPYFEHPKPLSIRADAPPAASTVFRTDGRTWSPLPQPPSQPYLRLYSMCVDGDRNLWVAGSVFQVDDDRAVVGERGYVAMLGDGRWLESPLPAPEHPHVTWRVSRIVCSAAGPWAIGGAITDPQGIRSWLGTDTPLVYRRVGGVWRTLALPALGPSAGGSAPSAVEISAAALDADGRLWIGYARRNERITDPIHSFDGETWTAHAVPEVHGVDVYHVHDIAFDDRGEGWAISGTWDGDAWSQGILLRFRDGQWHLQNWTWPFWRQRWLGLFG